MQVVPAVVVVALDPQKAVAPPVAGRHERVVRASRGVLDQGHDRAPLIRDERVADGGRELHERGAARLHRHPLRQVERVEGPGVDHLGAGAVDDLDPLARAHARRLPRAGRNRDQLGHHQLPACDFSR